MHLSISTDCACEADAAFCQLTLIASLAVAGRERTTESRYTTADVLVFAERRATVDRITGAS
jgi:hypothetical protein